MCLKLSIKFDYVVFELQESKKQIKKLLTKPHIEQTVTIQTKNKRLEITCYVRELREKLLKPRKLLQCTLSCDSPLNYSVRWTLLFLFYRHESENCPWQVIIQRWPPQNLPIQMLFYSVISLPFSRDGVYFPALWIWETLKFEENTVLVPEPSIAW